MLPKYTSSNDFLHIQDYKCRMIDSYLLTTLKSLRFFLAVVNHTNSYVFLGLTPSYTWFISVSYFFLSKIAVPMFLMCTGALMLGNNDPYHKHYQRLKRFLLVFLTVSLIYYYINNIEAYGYRGIASVFSDLFSRPASNALWYLYLYLGIQITLPFLQKMTSVLKRKDILIFITLCFCASGSPDILKRFFDIELYQDFDPSILSYPLGYLFSGYYIHKYGAGDLRSVVAALFFVLMSLFISVVLTYESYGLEIKTFLFWSKIWLPNIVIMSLGAFFFLRFLCCNLELCIISKYMTNLSKCTFGVYLVSDYVLVRTQPGFMELSRIMNPFIACIAWQFAIIFLSFMIVFIVRMISPIRRFIKKFNKKVVNCLFGSQKTIGYQ